jgi:hypothetical protein
MHAHSSVAVVRTAAKRGGAQNTASPAMHATEGQSIIENRPAMHTAMATVRRATASRGVTTRWRRLH